MSRRIRLGRSLCLLCCLLTAAASGDDFCLVRLIVGQPRAAAVLPLDDPNTDFLQAGDGAAWGDAVAHVPVAAVVALLLAPAPDCQALPAPRPGAPAESAIPPPTPPLRC